MVLVDHIEDHKPCDVYAHQHSALPPPLLAALTTPRPAPPQTSRAGASMSATMARSRASTRRRSASSTALSRWGVCGCAGASLQLPLSLPAGTPPEVVQGKQASCWLAHLLSPSSRQAPGLAACAPTGVPAATSLHLQQPSASGRSEIGGRSLCCPLAPRRSACGAAALPRSRPRSRMTTRATRASTSGGALLTCMPNGALPPLHLRLAA